MKKDRTVTCTCSSLFAKCCKKSKKNITNHRYWLMSVNPLHVTATDQQNSTQTDTHSAHSSSTTIERRIFTVINAHKELTTSIRYKSFAFFK